MPHTALSQTSHVCLTIRSAHAVLGYSSPVKESSSGMVGPNWSLRNCWTPAGSFAIAYNVVSCCRRAAAAVGGTRSMLEQKQRRKRGGRKWERRASLLCGCRQDVAARMPGRLLSAICFRVALRLLLRSKSYFKRRRSPAVVYSSLLDGEAKAVVRRAFTLARLTTPCVSYFDEIDAILGSDGDRGSGGSSGSRRGMGRVLSSSAEARALSSFWNEMNCVDGSRKDGVLVLGSTNQFWTLDAALLRPDGGTYIERARLEDKRRSHSRTHKQKQSNAHYLTVAPDPSTSFIASRPISSSHHDDFFLTTDAALGQRPAAGQIAMQLTSAQHSSS